MDHHSSQPTDQHPGQRTTGRIVSRERTKPCKQGFKWRQTMADTCNYNYLQIIHYSYNSLNCVAYSDTIQIELEDFLRQPRSTRQYSLMAVAIHREGCLVCSSVRTFFSISCHVNTNHNHFVCGQVNSSKLVSQGAHWATSELG